MSRSRRWHEPRQAYAPRLWPIVAVTGAVIVAVNAGLWYGLGIYLPWWGTDLEALAVALALSRWNWRRWKRKHPIVAPAMKVRARLTDEGELEVEVAGLELLLLHVEHQREVARWQ